MLRRTLQVQHLWLMGDGLQSKSKLKMQSSWDSNWEKIYSSKEWGKYPPEELIRFIARNFYNKKIRSNVNVLDLGCGTGVGSWFIAREGFSSYGIDGSETAIKIAKQRFEEENLLGNFKVGDLINLDYPHNFFDAVIDLAALQHNKIEDIKLILNKVYSTIKPGGKLFSLMLSKSSKFNHKELDGYTHFFEENEIKELFSGFNNLIIETSERSDGGNTISHFVVSAEKRNEDNSLNETPASEITSIKIGNKVIGKDHPCFIIAEAGINHNGSLELAKRLVDISVEAGVDAVKFQTFDANEEVTKKAQKIEYQKEGQEDKESYLEMIKKLELSEEEHKVLIDYCKQKGIIFLSTPSEGKSAKLLQELGVEAFKVGSNDIVTYPLLAQIAAYNKPLIVSRGMASREEISGAIDIIRENQNNEIILLHCTSNYPTNLSNVNLSVIKTLSDEFNVLSGYSDHSEGLQAPMVAALLGAVVIEKHITLDKSFPGPDQAFSVGPLELKQMVSEIRKIDFLSSEERRKRLSLIENLNIILGNPNILVSDSEMKMREQTRKSIVAGTDLCSGNLLTLDNLAFKRPAGGISAKHYKSILGKKLKLDLSKDEIITFEQLE
jgi:N,N'-diacetyllegionaminate synthase